MVGRREAVAGVLSNNTSALDFSFFVSGSFGIVVLGWLTRIWFICGLSVKSQTPKTSVGDIVLVYTNLEFSSG